MIKPITNIDKTTQKAVEEALSAGIDKSVSIRLKRIEKKHGKMQAVV